MGSIKHTHVKTGTCPLRIVKQGYHNQTEVYGGTWKPIKQVPCQLTQTLREKANEMRDFITKTSKEESSTKRFHVSKWWQLWLLCENAEEVRSFIKTGPFLEKNMKLKLCLSAHSNFFFVLHRNSREAILLFLLSSCPGLTVQCFKYKTHKIKCLLTIILGKEKSK